MSSFRKFSKYLEDLEDAVTQQYDLDRRLNDVSHGKYPKQELKSPAIAIKEFASQLTERAYTLQKLEATYKITTGQSADILSGMIENFVWAVVKTLRKIDIEQEELERKD